MIKFISIITAPFFLFSCASIKNGQSQALSVSTGHVSGAKCCLTNDKGSWNVTTTPGNTTVRRTSGDLTVSCKKDDLSGTTKVTSSATPVTAANIILPGSLLWAAIDCTTGSAFGYPEKIKVEMK